MQERLDVDADNGLSGGANEVAVVTVAKTDSILLANPERISALIEAHSLQELANLALGGDKAFRVRLDVSLRGHQRRTFRLFKDSLESDTVIRR